MNTDLLDQARKLSIEERIALAEAIWDTIPEKGVPIPTKAQIAELDRRLAEHQASPEDVVSWEEIRDEALARMRQ
jgi:putative addiction module component (TIGR02574 family)